MTEANLYKNHKNQEDIIFIEHMWSILINRRKRPKGICRSVKGGLYRWPQRSICRCSEGNHYQCPKGWKRDSL